MSNAYEIRHALLNEARETLFDIWRMKCDEVRHNAQVEERPFRDGEMPPPPNFDDVLNLARRMNEFVSEK